MALSILSSLSLLVSFLSFVSSKAIYDIHAFERLNLSDTFAIQGSKPVTNGKMMESGMKRLQPPRALARQIVEGKRRRASPMDTAPFARRSASPDIPPCGLINVVNADTGEFLGILILLPIGLNVYTVATDLGAVGFDFRQYKVWVMPSNPTGIFVIGLEDFFNFAGTVLGAVWMDPLGSTAGPFDLGKGSPNIALLEPQATTIFYNNQFFDHSVGITGDLDAAVAAAKAQAPPDTCNIEFDKVPIRPCAIAVKFFYTESREAGTCPPPWDGF
ncbi:hypothetical protein SISNIDRAFT_456698 [Sistotremastrum niveocremeum HHB9708]|uniref:Uncharacterized protein n=1 Tax=Sistotremastrum niveocremeum HHB9708 TaxID=1314777 RepID=A0A164SFU0_9AGAM|nr:hypothetical protein SISNIDRAFT_456698 [Sistotremastrum niveocremeum HHB9708]